MTTMTAHPMDDHINSKEWSLVDTKMPGSEEYESSLGLMRMMFNIKGDPIEILTLLSEDASEVWVQNSDLSWKQVF